MVARNPNNLIAFGHFNGIGGDMARLRIALPRQEDHGAGRYRAREIRVATGIDRDCGGRIGMGHAPKLNVALGVYAHRGRGRRRG